MAFPVWNSQMNAPTTMLSTPAAAGFRVLISSSSASRPSGSSCQGTNRLIRADESKTASRVAGIDLDVIMVAVAAIARAGLIAPAAWGQAGLPGGAIAGPSRLLAQLPLLTGEPGALPAVLSHQTPVANWTAQS
jgi:hypothetical protein